MHRNLVFSTGTALERQRGPCRTARGFCCFHCVFFIHAELCCTVCSLPGEYRGETDSAAGYGCGSGVARDAGCPSARARAELNSQNPIQRSGASFSLQTTSLLRL